MIVRRQQKYVMAFVIPLLSFVSLLRLWIFHHSHHSHSSDNNNNENNRSLLPPPPPTEIFVKDREESLSLPASSPPESRQPSSLQSLPNNAVVASTSSSSASSSSLHPKHPMPFEAAAAFNMSTNVSLVLPRNNVSLRVHRLLQNYSGTIEPMWTCSAKGATEKQNNNRDKKLVFVHVFKTAGSTFRTFFYHYSVTCHKGYALLVQCSGLRSSLPPPTISSSSTTMTNTSYRNTTLTTTTTTTWTNGFGRHKNKPCVVKAFVDPHRRPIGTRTVSNKLLQQHNIDVLIGHLPVGVHEHWRTMMTNDRDDTASTAAAVQAQYVAFFREPLHKYVSGIVFSSAKKLSKMTFNETVQMIQQRVRAERAKGHFHEGYSAYLLTPEQKELFYGSAAAAAAAKMKKKGKQQSLEDRIELILNNLVDLNVLVGIVERMPESLELLQHVVDGKKELTRSFDYLSGNSGNKRDDDTTTPNRTTTKVAPALVMNKSKMSTRDIVQALLQQDETAVRDLEEYLKYDTIIYQFALEMHKRQYQRLHA